MLKASFKYFFAGFLLILCCNANAQQKVLTMKDAEQMALSNYASIKAKMNQLNASKAFLTETKNEYLPDLSLSAQQAYGTVNSQFGPSYGYKGLGVASSGPILANQNWNAGFGALYLANVNWDFFAFGRAVEKVKVQKTVVNRDETDLAQEQFQHQVRVAAAYLDLLAAQQLAKAQQDNLNRTIDLQKVVVARVKNGLNPGVDSSQANAEVSNARIALTNAQQTVLDQSNQLALYLGLPHQTFELDSVFVSKAPANAEIQPSLNLDDHPILKFYRNRIGVSDEQAKYLNTFNYPTFTFFGVYQGRGSGFGSAYSLDQSAYTSGYGTGVDPTRFNYLLGIGVTWDFTNLFRVSNSVKAQKFTSEQYRNEYELVSQQLHDQASLAETRIASALKNYREVPVEVKAASDAYLQKYTLYKNGLANIVDLTQALYTLNRAEIDKDIAYNNLWQALLYKSASVGDFGIFINNF
ncbi:MAG TPA: TolC family protein [Mucilaginibacter sp.]|jgi:outer membrane protein TolC|nr:TolC family protein [Mucilaginibacter sp.]